MRRRDCITTTSAIAIRPSGGACGYDSRDRLTLAQKGSPVSSTQQFAYDAVGNAQNITVDGALTNLTFGSDSDQLAAKVNEGSPIAAR